MRNRLALLCALAFHIGCGDDSAVVTEDDMRVDSNDAGANTGRDSGTGDGGAGDATVADAGAQRDTGAAPDGSTPDAGTDLGMPAPSTCPASATSPTLCAEEISGAPGETVQLGIFVYNDSSCGGVDSFSGQITLDEDAFVLSNPVSNADALMGDNRCTRQVPSPGSVGMFTWGVRNENNDDCGGPFDAGRWLVLEIEIQADAEPGVYPIAWSERPFLFGPEGSPGSCSDFTQSGSLIRIDGSITVR